MDNLPSINLIILLKFTHSLHGGAREAGVGSFSKRNRHCPAVKTLTEVLIVKAE